MRASADLLDSAKRLLAPLGGEPPREKTFAEKLEDQLCGWVPALTWEQRVGGCLCCVLVGLVLEIGSFFRFTQLVLGKPGPFATLYSLGNVSSSHLLT